MLRQLEALQDGTGKKSKKTSEKAGDTSRVAGRPPRTLSEARLGSDGRPQMEDLTHGSHCGSGDEPASASIAGHTNIVDANSAEALQALQT